LGAPALLTAVYRKFPDDFGKAPDAFQDGEIGALQSIVPGPGPSGEQNKANVVGDDPNLPRDPDKFDGTVDGQREFRERAAGDPPEPDPPGLYS
jgi:hypothetical protein